MQLPRTGLLAGAALAALLLGALPTHAQTGQTTGQDGAPQTTQSTTPGSFNTPPDFSDLARSRLPMVVAITTRQRVEDPVTTMQDDLPFGDRFRRFFEDTLPQPRQQRPRGALGSGFVIDNAGHIVTNNHVIANADEIRVILNDRTTRPATLVGRDPATDLAVLKVDQLPANTPNANWGNSEALAPGDWTIAIGSPFGLGGTVTVGVLSAISRDIQAGPYDDFLQTDASINSGNSGGPLFNVRGEVIGVNTAIFSPTGGNVGIGFAIPANVAQPVVRQIVETGRVERGFIGVAFQPVTESIAKALRLENTNAALIANVEPNSPAARAGLRSGDVIVSFNNQPLQNPRYLSRLVAQQRAGAQVPITIIRDGNRQQLALTIGSRRGPETAEAQTETTGETQQPRLGVQLSQIDDAARARLGLEGDENGVLVGGVQPGSRAAEEGLRRGDVILSVNNQPISEPADVARQWRQAVSNSQPLLMRVKRGAQYLFIAVDNQAG